MSKDIDVNSNWYIGQKFLRDGDDILTVINIRYGTILILSSTFFHTLLHMRTDRMYNFPAFEELLEIRNEEIE